MSSHGGRSHTSRSSSFNPDIRPPVFVVPKGKKVVQIVSPPTIALQKTKLTYSEAASKKISQKQSEQQAIKDELEIPPVDQASSSGVRNRSVNDRPSTQPDLETNSLSSSSPPYHDGHIQPQTRLDVLARNYVPTWLRAVNDSYASFVPCQPLNTINFDEYVSQYCGRQSLRSRSPYPTPIVDNHELPDHLTLNISNYSARWNKLQNTEFNYLDQQLFGYRLYNVPYLRRDAVNQLYHFRIPGLRDDAPRIDLGDVVLVRPLVPVLQGHIAQETSQWYAESYGFRAGKPAPGFFGLEFQAIVWGIARGREEVMLRIDQLPSSSSTFNLIFQVQGHKVAILDRAISCVGAQLQKRSLWMRSMLFPSPLDANVQRKLTTGQFNLGWYDGVLNFEQKKAVAAVVQANYGAVPFLISGPPGTGKTKTIVEAALQLLQNTITAVEPHLLICAPSDSAADTLANRLSRHLNPSELFRMNGWTRAFADVPGNLMSNCYSHNDLFSLPDFKTMMAYKVVVTTCRDSDLLVQARLTNDDLEHLAHHTLSTIAPAANAKALHMVHWTALLLDEAAQATEPEALVPLSVVARNKPLSADSFQPQVIMAGDEFQLGPRLSSQSEKNGLEISLFQRLFERPFYADHPLSRANGSRPLTASLLPLARPAFVNLIRNYRSHPAILTTSSSLFYHNTLIPEQESIQPEIQSWPGWKEPYHWPVLFHQNTSPDSVEDITSGDGTGAGSLINKGEVETALAIVKSMIRHCEVRARTARYQHDQNIFSRLLKHDNIIVMSPFRAQVSLLRAEFRKAGLYAVNIGPVEAFQGLESRVVVLCTTRTYPDSQAPPPSSATAATTAESHHQQVVEKFVRQDQSRALGIIDEPKRFNVAITRAKEGLIVIGDARTLTCTDDPVWMEFISFCRRNGCVSGDEQGIVKDLNLGARDGTRGEGQLERALKFAAENDRDIRDVRRLGMRVYDEEEKMWMAGGGMMLHPDNDDEYEDDEEDANDDDDDHNNGETDGLSEGDEILHDSQAPKSTTQKENRVSARDLLRMNDTAGATVKEEFDRDLELELKREGCATQ